MLQQIYYFWDKLWDFWDRFIRDPVVLLHQAVFTTGLASGLHASVRYT
jgi:hypothetical protein